MKKKKQNKSIAPLILFGLGGVLVIAALVIGLGGNSAATQAPLPTQTTAALMTNPHGSQNTTGIPQSPDEVKRTSLADAYGAFEANIAVFVDTRDKASYDQGHIPGAISIPEAELPLRLGELDPNMLILTYCT